MDKIIIGANEFYGRTLKDGNCFVANSLPCDELTIDTLRTTVDGAKERGTKFIPKGSSGLLTSDDEAFYVRPYIRVLVTDPTAYQYGAPVDYYHDGTLIGRFYAEKIRRVGKTLYEITCTSAVGLLDKATAHYGGLYTGQTVKTILTDIIGDIVLYTIDLELENIPVYGWLPIATRRENLHQLLFALGISLRKSADGILHFTSLTSETAASIGDARIYMGGDADYMTPATAVDVTEHAYHAYDTDELTTLFEGEAAAESIKTPNGEHVVGVLVKFSGPMHDISAEGASIIESGVNYAVLGPSADCKLMGKKYTHTTRIIRSGTTAAAENVKTVANATLVSLANSENVAKRVFAYYSEAQTVNLDIVSGDERPGDSVTFNDPFDEPKSGFIQSMDIAMSNILKAASKLVSGYVPVPPGNFYTQSVLKTAPGAWTVPPGVTKIRAVLGSGGWGGYSGGQGKQGVGGGRGNNSMGAGGDPGVGGLASQGGKILVVTIPVLPGQVINFNPGSGGLGGICTGEEPAIGNEGTPTTFGQYSSAEGKSSAIGFTDIFGKGTFGVQGNVGNPGGKGSGSGGAGDPVDADGVQYHSGESARDISPANGYAQGGAGGGAGYGADGLPGEEGSVSRQSDGTYFATGGAGGRGGPGRDGVDAAGYGGGGHAGHGGGGGGAGGSASSASGVNYTSRGDGGDGGHGGHGGQGSPGWAIIYY